MQKVSVYEQWQLTFEQDPGSIEVTDPCGRKTKKRFFERRPVSFSYETHGYEIVTPEGKTVYSVRYTPLEAGEYTWRTETGETGCFLAADTGRHGFIHKGEKDPRYFAFTDGTPFPVIGLNLANLTYYKLSSHREFGLSEERATLGLREYERWFRKLSEAGGNHARLWVGQEYFTPDTEDPFTLRLEQFEKLDAVVKLAEKYGIYLKLTIDHFRFFEGSRYADVYGPDLTRLFGKRFVINGTACETMTRWLRGEEYRKAWEQKAAAYTDRYADDPTVMIFEFWNEMNAVEADWRDVIDWNVEMIRRLRPLAPRQMWANSLGSMDAPGNVDMYYTFPAEKFDFCQFHRYLDQGAPLEVCRSDAFEFTKDGIRHARRKDAPVLLAETGAVNDCHSGPFRYYMSDDDGRIFVDTVYPALFYGSAGCGQIWHWGVYVEQKKLFGLLRPLSELVKGIDFQTEAFESEDRSTETYKAVFLKGKRHALILLRNAEDRWDRVLRDGMSANAIGKIEFRLERAAKCELLPIWTFEPAQAHCEGETLTVDGLTYGALLRLTY